MNETNSSSYSGSSPATVHPVYYELDFQVALVVIFGTLSIVGIFGNIMVVAVVLTVRGMMSPTNCYLVSLAIADCLFFISSMPVEIAAMFLPKDVYIFGRIGCPILTFLPYLAINSSSLSIAAFTIERYIAICHPMKAQYICTIKRAKLIIIGVWCFSVLYNSAWLYLVKAKPLANPVGQVTCTFTLDRRNYKIIYLTDIFLFYCVPLMLYFALYGRMACILFKANFRCHGDEKRLPGRLASDASNRLLSKQQSDECMTNGIGARADSIGSPLNKENNANKKRKSYHSDSKAIGASSNKNRVQVVKMLVVIVCIFAICWLPYRGLVVYNSFAVKKWATSWYLLFAKSMITVNCAINPILYNLMSAKFRRAFKLMFAQVGLTCGYNRLYLSSYVSGMPTQLAGVAANNLRKQSSKKMSMFYANPENKIKEMTFKNELITPVDTSRRKSAL